MALCPVGSDTLRGFGREKGFERYLTTAGQVRFLASQEVCKVLVARLYELGLQRELNEPGWLIAGYVVSLSRVRAQVLW